MLGAYDPEPLPLRVRHHPLEPATSLISRLAARNGVVSVTDFCRDIGFPYKALLRGERHAIVQLSRLAECDAEALWRVSIRNLGQNALRLRDERATTHTLHRSKVRICPDCIRQDAGPAAEAWRAAAGDMAIRLDPVLSGSSLRPVALARREVHFARV